MGLHEYKRKQMEQEDLDRPHYNLKPLQFTPIEQYYTELEYSLLLKLLYDLVSPADRQTILVCGIGAGGDLHYWLNHMGLTHAVGLDFSIECIKATQRRIELNNLPRITSFVQADFEDIPLQDNAVDVGIFVYTLHHAMDPKRAFQELRRVSRRAIVLLEPAFTPATQLFTKLGLAVDTEVDGNKVLRFSIRDFLSWCNDEPIAWKGSLHFYYYHPLIYRRVLPLFNSPLGLSVFKLLHQAVDKVCFPLRSKLAMVISKEIR